MNKDNNEQYREILVKAVHVWIAAAFVLFLCASFFFLGRWYERSVSPYSDASHGDSGEHAARDVAQKAGASEDLGESLTFFDTLPKEDPSDLRSAASTRQSKPTEAVPPQSTTAPRTQTKGDRNSYTIQIFASKERTASSSLNDKLRKDGYDSYIYEEKSRSGTIFKVRVGRFATKNDAARTESNLRKDGYGTWVTTID